MSLSELYSDEIKALCLKYKVKQLSAFGSIVKGGFNEESDIDLIVDFEPLSINEYARNYFALKFAIQDHFNCTVDLLEGKEVNNPYFKQAIQAHKQTVYAS